MNLYKYIVRMPLDSAKDLLEALGPTSQYFDSSQPHIWLFRGECDYEVPLCPTIYRPDGWERACRMADVNKINHHDDISNNSEVFQMRVELELLRRFISYADESGLAIPDYSPTVGYWLRDYGTDLDRFLRTERFTAGSVAHPIDGFMNRRDQGHWPCMMIRSILAMARHHGMPSRLLDWTLSAPIAAYFAAKEVVSLIERNQDLPATFSVWALSRDTTGKLKDLPKPHPAEFRYIRTPSFGNRHMIAQRGVFTSRITYPDELYDPRDERGLPDLLHDRLEYLAKYDPSYLSDNEDPFLIRFQVPSSEYDKLLYNLCKIGVSGNIVFPTYQGVVDTIAEELHFPQR